MHNVRMLQPERACFIEKVGQLILFQLWQHFNRYEILVIYMLAQIDFTEAAYSQEPNQVVTVNLLSHMIYHHRFSSPARYTTRYLSVQRANDRSKKLYIPLKNVLNEPHTALKRKGYSGLFTRYVLNR